jgi:hypothetical protein
VRRAAAALALLLALTAPAGAHALNEYLQATLVSVHKNRIDASLRLVPGVAVFPAVLAGIDANADGIVSPVEAQAYARRVLVEIKLGLDGHSLVPQLESVIIPAPAVLKDGLGEIRIDFSAALPPGGANRRLVIENHHQKRISAYLVNALISQDSDIRLLVQKRNADQSFYELDYSQAGGAAGRATADAGGFVEMFRLGMRHIAEGTDHLLFLLTLLLPIPLLVRGGRWAGPTTIRISLLHIAGVVTAFTLGHSVTLALAGTGIVAVPGRPVEVLIAASILVSAIHALRPLFPGREAFVASFFGLIHGLAFATVLGRLGLGPWERAANLLGFNLGIEAMQLIVVTAALPSLLLLSRTPAYIALRTGGAVFAGTAALGWIAERLWGLQMPVDLVVNAVAQRAVLLALILFLAGLICWRLRGVATQPAA